MAELRPDVFALLAVPETFGKEKENGYMKLSTMCKNLLPGLALLLATSAFAANCNASHFLPPPELFFL
jgi:hypothetical protein